MPERERTGPPERLPALLASDLDGTLIPPDDSGERLREIDRFRHVVDAMGLTLAYVTGRHLSLALEGMERFRLPPPEALSCDVGTTVYWRRDGAYVEDSAYRDALASAPGVVAAERIRSALADVPGLRMQGTERQATFKASYYVEAGSAPSVVAQVEARLAEVGDVRLVASHDPITGDDLLDVLPGAVGKASAVRHLADRLGLQDDQVVFAGDSGNDRDALLSGVRAIVVGNAPDDLRRDILSRAEGAGLAHRVFLASARFAAGVVQGLEHFGAVT